MEYGHVNANREGSLPGFILQSKPIWCMMILQGGDAMAEYELVWEIKNLCRNNQMRDIFFEEVECDERFMDGSYDLTFCG